MVTKLDGIATPFGKLTLKLKISADGKTAKLHIEPLADASCRKIIVHLSRWASANKTATIKLNPNKPVDRAIPLKPGLI